MRNTIKAIGAAVFLIICLWVGWDEVVVRLTGEHATGTVVEVDDGGSRKHASWEFPVTLPDGSRTTVVAEEHILVFVPEMGSEGTVIYDPADPENRAVFGSFPGPMETLTVLFTLGVLLFAWWVTWEWLHERQRPVSEPTVVAAAQAESIVRQTARSTLARGEDRRRAAQRRAARQRAGQRRARGK